MSPLAILVEDDPFHAAYASDAVAAVAPDTRLLAFADLREALNALAGYVAMHESADQPVVLFVELALLSRERHAVAEAVRRHKAITRVHVVAILASDDAADRQRAYELGADDVMFKPADPAFLARILRSRPAPALAAAA